MPPGSFQSLPPGFQDSLAFSFQDDSFRTSQQHMNLQDSPRGMMDMMSWAPAQMQPTDSMRSMAPMNQPLQTRARIWDSYKSGGNENSDAAAQHLFARLRRAENTNEKLEKQLNDMTDNHWKEYMSKHFSSMTKADLANVDWRAVRVNYCKDPIYNKDIPLDMLMQVKEGKKRDAAVLEQKLGEEAIQKWAERLKQCNPPKNPPPEEVVLKPGCPYVQVHPGYRVWDDMWERELTLRNLDEALRGNLMNPMPRPVLFGEDYENHHTGRYLKDDCPIA
jgi:hypothetical protein